MRRKRPEMWENVKHGIPVLEHPSDLAHVIFVLFSMIKSVLKVTPFHYVNAVKSKVTELNDGAINR